MSARDAGTTLESENWPQFGGPADRCHVLTTSLGVGTPLGTTRSGKAAGVQLLRPTPVRIAVVGAAWLASLLAIRATILGATTVILTDRPAPWGLLAQTVGGTQPFASIVSADNATLPQPTVVDPVFVLHDGSANGSETAIARSPWQTSLHLIFRISQQSIPLLDATDLILLPQPAPEEIDTTLEMLRLPSAMAAQFARMGPAEFLAVTRSRAVFLTVQATPTEMTVLRPH